MAELNRISEWPIQQSAVIVNVGAIVFEWPVIGKHNWLQENYPFADHNAQAR